ncbi:MAG: putative peptidoglycan binding domain [Candidatus Parcubacteria bacterium]|jgi:peptidoglycan hydrolase-like protein with peptidoglycan-binding domain
MKKITFIFALLLSAPLAYAESPNILVGQDMTIGSSNQGVVVLQGLLSETGYLQIPMGVPMGYYGGITKNALSRYQAAQGVTPSVGYFGPVTKTAMHEDLRSHNWLGLLGW